MSKNVVSFGGLCPPNTTQGALPLDPLLLARARQAEPRSPLCGSACGVPGCHSDLLATLIDAQFRGPLEDITHNIINIFVMLK